MRRDFRTAPASRASADDALKESTDNPPNSWQIYRLADVRVPANRRVIVKWFRLIQGQFKKLAEFAALLRML